MRSSLSGLTVGFGKGNSQAVSAKSTTKATPGLVALTGRHFVGGTGKRLSSRIHASERKGWRAIATPPPT